MVDSDILKPGSVQYKSQPLEYFGFVKDVPCLELNPLDGTYSLLKKIQVEVIDKTDRAIVDTIVKAAREAGVTDLYLLDKQFIIEAITEKMEREGKKNG